jgi:hypothetical protein
MTTGNAAGGSPSGGTLAEPDVELVTALHEAGHAVVAHFHRVPVLRVSIDHEMMRMYSGLPTPPGRGFGQTEYGDSGEMDARIVAAITLAGLAAEAIHDRIDTHLLTPMTLHSLPVLDPRYVENIADERDFQDVQHFPPAVLGEAFNRARFILHRDWKRVRAIADALLAAPDGVVEGDALHALLAD